MEQIRDIEAEDVRQVENVGEENKEGSRSRSSSISSVSRAETTDTENEEDYERRTIDVNAGNINDFETESVEEENAAEQIVEIGTVSDFVKNGVVEEVNAIEVLGKVIGNTQQLGMINDESTDDQEIKEVLEYLVRNVVEIELNKAKVTDEESPEDLKKGNKASGSAESITSRSSTPDFENYEEEWYFGKWTPDVPIVSRKEAAIVVRGQADEELCCKVFRPVLGECFLYDINVSKRFEGLLNAGTVIICDIGESEDGSYHVRKVHEIDETWLYPVQNNGWESVKTFKQITEKDELIAIGPEDQYLVLRSYLGLMKIYDFHYTHPDNEDLIMLIYLGSDILEYEEDEIECRWFSLPLDPKLEARVFRADVEHARNMEEFQRERNQDRSWSRASTILSGDSELKADEENLEEDMKYFEEKYSENERKSRLEEWLENEVIVERRGRWFSK